MRIKMISQAHYNEVMDIATPQISFTFNKPSKIFSGVAAYEGDKMVAFILLHPERPGLYSIPSVATRIGEHGKGHVKALFKYLFEKVGGDYWLEVHPNNTRARALYEAAGFKFTQGVGCYDDGIACLIGERYEH